MTDDLVARANLAALVPVYDSKAEEWWATYGALLLADELAQAVSLTLYHPLTFHLPGGSYTPDYCHILADGTMVVIEVKGSKMQKNYRDARAKLRAAADVYRWLTWYEARVDGRGGFELERIAP
jgi:hypothetical protein